MKAKIKTIEEFKADNLWDNAFLTAKDFNENGKMNWMFGKIIEVDHIDEGEFGEYKYAEKYVIKNPDYEANPYDSFLEYKREFWYIADIHIKEFIEEE